MESTQINLREQVSAFARDLVREHQVIDHVAFTNALADEMAAYAKDVATFDSETQEAFDASVAEFEGASVGHGPLGEAS